MGNGHDYRTLDNAAGMVYYYLRQGQRQVSYPRHAAAGLAKVLGPVGVYAEQPANGGQTIDNT